MNHKIVIGIDFSKSSISALEHAILLAKHLPVDLILLWVREPDFNRAPIYKYSTIEMEMSVLLRELVDEYSPKIQGKIEYTIRYGKAYRGIIDECYINQAYMLFIGRTGYDMTDVKQSYGKNVSRLMGVIDTPIIIIPEVKEVCRCKKMVMPIDETPSSRQKAPFASFFYKKMNTETHILSIYHTSIKAVKVEIDQYTHQVLEYLDKKNVPYHHETLECKNLATAVLDYCDINHIDLLVIMSEQTTTTSNLLRGSYPQQILSKCTIPLMVIKPRYTNQIRAGY